MLSCYWPSFLGKFRQTSQHIMVIWASRELPGGGDHQALQAGRLAGWLASLTSLPSWWRRAGWNEPWGRNNVFKYVLFNKFLKTHLEMWMLSCYYLFFGSLGKPTETSQHIMVIWASHELPGGGGHQALQAGWLSLELIVTQPLGEQPLLLGYLCCDQSIIMF